MDFLCWLVIFKQALMGSIQNAWNPPKADWMIKARLISQFYREDIHKKRSKQFEQYKQKIDPTVKVSGLLQLMAYDRSEAEVSTNNKILDYIDMYDTGKEKNNKYYGNIDEWKKIALYLRYKSMKYSHRIDLDDILNSKNIYDDKPTKIIEFILENTLDL